MAPDGQRQDTRYWYKVSVDAVRAWTTIAAVLVIGIGGFWGYTLLSRHFLEREVIVAIEESEILLERLMTERDLEAHREKVNSGAERLVAAKARFDEGNLREARDEAARCLSMLTAVDEALRHRSPAGEAQFVATHGKVEVRRGDRGEWRPARSRMWLYAGDYVKTSANGSAEGMMVDGTLFTVRPNTVLLVTRTRSMMGLRSERTLSLESGWVNLSTAQTTSRITTPEAEATVRERSDAVVAYNDERKVGSFSNYRGELTVAASDGVTRQIGELETVVQDANGLSEAKPLPAAPELSRPDDNREFALGDENTVQLAWNQVDGAEAYALQVSQSRLFADNVIDDARRVKTSATLGLRGEGSFLWRVAALDGEGQRGPWSRIQRFRVVEPVSARPQTTDIPAGTLGQGG